MMVDPAIYMYRYCGGLNEDGHTVAYIWMPGPHDENVWVGL